MYTRGFDAAISPHCLAGLHCAAWLKTGEPRCMTQAEALATGAMS